MPYITQKTDRNAEIATLESERKYMIKRHNEAEKEAKPFICRLISQIDRDIARNREHLREILR